MQKLLARTDNIELKIKQTISKLEILKKENEYLKEENQNLVEKLKQQKGIIKELEIKSKHIEPEAKGIIGDADKASLRNEIDTYIADIDQVIDVLRTY